MPRLVLTVVVLSASLAAAFEPPHIEVAVNPFEVSLSVPDAKVGVSRVYSTSGSLTVFVGHRLGFRLLGGSAWYSALGLVTTDVAAVFSPVLLPTWWGQGGLVWRFEPLRDLLWLDTHLDAGLLNAQLGLSQAQGNLAAVSVGSHPAISVGVSTHVRLERHIALNVGVRASIFSIGTPKASGCSEGDLQHLAAAEAQGQDVDSAPVGSGCQSRSFHELPPGSSAVALGAIQGRGALFSGNLSVELGFAFF